MRLASTLVSIGCFLFLGMLAFAEIVPRKVLFIVSDKVGSLYSKRTSFPNKYTDLPKIEKGNRITVEFNVFDSKDNDDTPLKLTQSHVVFSKDDGSEEVVFNTKFIEAKYKYKLDLSSKKLSSAFNSNGEYKVELVLGSITESKGVIYEIGSIEIAALDKQKPVNDYRKYTYKEEIEATPPTPEKMVHPLFSIIYAGFILAPFVGLLYIYHLRKVNYQSLFKSSASINLFFGFVSANIGIIFSYWVGVKLFPTMGCLLITLVPTVIFGVKALRE